MLLQKFFTGESEEIKQNLRHKCEDYIETNLTEKKVYQVYGFNLLRAESDGKFGSCVMEITSNLPHFATLVVVFVCLADE